MTNLLPPEEKRQLILENKKKLVIIFGIMVFIPLFCLILVLLSLQFYLLGQISSQKLVFTEASKEYQTPGSSAFENLIRKDNVSLSRLAAFYHKEIYVTDVLENIANLPRPPKVYFTNISLMRAEDGKIQVTAAGFSDTRNDLLAFQKNISSDGQIQDSDFSPESWVNPQNINFELTFQINKPINAK